VEAKFSIIIPNWNGKKLLEKNLPVVLEACANKKNKIGEVIVVDDGSSDDSVSLVKEQFGTDVRLVKHGVNKGFSYAVNTGVRYAKYPYVCLLNTDVIPSDDFLVSVAKHFANKSVFGVSLHEKGYGYAKARFRNGFIEHDPGEEAGKPKRTFWVSGGSGVFRREYWMKLGGMDGRLMSPFYWEDVELCYRAQKRGYICIWEPNAKVEHKHESVINVSSFGKRHLNIIKERNQLLFIWKNLTSSNLMRKHLRGLARRVMRNPGYVVVVMAALKRLRTVLTARKREMKESSVSDEAIFAGWMQ